VIYQNVQLEKEMVLGQQDWPFKGQRPQERPKTFLAYGSRAELAEVGWLAGCSRPLSLARAHCCAQCTQCISPGCPPGCVSRNIPAQCSGPPEVMFSLPPSLTNLLSAAVYFVVGTASALAGS